MNEELIGKLQQLLSGADGAALLSRAAELLPDKAAEKKPAVPAAEEGSEALLLLQALRPYMKGIRREKLDRLCRAVQLSTVLSALFGENSGG